MTTTKSCGYRGCTAPVHVKGFCTSHYDQSRPPRKRTRSDRILANRARTRAMTRLAGMYPTAFQQLYDQELAKVVAENNQVAEDLGIAPPAPAPTPAPVATPMPAPGMAPMPTSHEPVEVIHEERAPVDLPTPTPAPVVPMKAGPRAAGQDPVDRVLTGIRSLCQMCGNHHERGHVCGECQKAADKAAAAAKEATGERARVKRLLVGGKSAQWLINAGENRLLVHEMLRELTNEAVKHRTSSH